MATSEAFDAAYKGLTSAQKRAVDAVEGPVLVIAGPGTGKTHILTLRIANILLTTQANPSNILVLTFTDSAARTIRRRLGGLVGEAVAREIFISTFHGFSEQILSQHAESFPRLLGRRLMGDVENTLLWREVFETEHIVHLRTPKSPFHYLKDVAMLQKDLVRERVTTAAYRAWAGEEAERVKADETLRYVRDGKTWAKGDLKPEGAKKLERLEKAYEAAALIDAYEALKEKRQVYDFGDVLRTVVDTLQEDQALASELQETFQYILADEHQDANALQHALLDALAFDEHPNLFVVGDEKQAIFRFQGADATHFKEFVTRYPRTEVIALGENFRSYQDILDCAHTLVTEHLPSAHGEHVSLTATRQGSARIQLLESPDPLAERDQVADLIEQAIEGGTLPHEIAVIASRNATADLMGEHLRARGIPVLRAGDIQLTARPFVRLVLAHMRCIANPLDISAVRESLLAPWLQIPLMERGRFLLGNRDHELMEALARSYPDIANTLYTLQEAALRLPPLELFSKLLMETGARGYALSHTEHLTDDLTLLRRLYQYVEELVARDTNASFKDIVDSLVKAEEHGLSSVKSSILQREGEVTVITAHKAKGMEFEKVFIVGLTANEWEKGGRGALIPSPIDASRSFDDVLRQFYVAITRAKNELVLSYARETGDGKERAPSLLIPKNTERIEVAFEQLPLLHETTTASEIVCALTRTYLREEGLSPSALKEYLESPACFFAKRVLRLKEPETPAITIGNAVHEGIAAYLEAKDEGSAYGALARSLSRSLLPRNAAFEQLSNDARARVAAYIAHTSELSEAIAIEKTYTLKKTVHNEEVLLRGKVDAIFSTDEGECIVDFKTSGTVRGHDEEYRHQLAFYDLLLREQGHTPARATIVQVTVEGVKEHNVPLSDETRAAFEELLTTVIEELLSGAWRAGEPSAYDDLITLFAAPR
ncbi:MAG TPA: ATP-dependent DNA helicase [Candidatus Paceibacterota bacterium]|nr:ATP-dependent DNA helicase [Candidatus Paceibacterota bacterium]